MAALRRAFRSGSNGRRRLQAEGPAGSVDDIINGRPLQSNNFSLRNNSREISRYPPWRLEGIFT